MRQTTSESALNDTRTSPFLSVGKVARMCGVSNRTVLNWIAQGRIEAHALPSGHFRVHVDEVRTFMQSNEMELPSRISEAAAVRDTLCWARRDLTEGHACERCQVLAIQALHCFVVRRVLGDAAVGCPEPCSSCRYLKAVIRPLGASLELDAEACAVSRGGVLLGANSQLCALLQRTQSEIIGLRWLDLARVADPMPLLASDHDPSSASAIRIQRLEGQLLRRDSAALKVGFLLAPFPRLLGAQLVRVEVLG